MDSKNESQVQEILKTLPHPMTQLVISHRLSTVKDADHVLVIAHGRLIQEGSFAQLASEEGFFREYIRLQSLLDETTPGV